MKLYAIIEVNDDMYDEFKEWYINCGYNTCLEDILGGEEE